MLAKKIKYVDFDGVERNETFYFNIRKDEAVELELTEEGGLIKSLLKMIEKQDMPQIFKLFKRLVTLSIGEKSPDGKYLMKSEEISNKFLCTNAYEQLFMEIMASPESAANFINSVLPQDVQADASKYDYKDGEIVNKETGEVLSVS